jgi:hypothetical protein
MQRSAAQGADIAALQPVRFESGLGILELRGQVEIPVEDGVRAMVGIPNLVSPLTEAAYYSFDPVASSLLHRAESRAGSSE